MARSPSPSRHHDRTAATASSSSLLRHTQGGRAARIARRALHTRGERRGNTFTRTRRRRRHEEQQQQQQQQQQQDDEEQQQQQAADARAMPAVSSSSLLLSSFAAAQRHAEEQMRHHAVVTSAAAAAAVAMVATAAMLQQQQQQGDDADAGAGTIDVESVYSECELVNDAMQDYLFATDDDDDSRSRSRDSVGEQRRHGRCRGVVAQLRTVAPFMSRAVQRTREEATTITTATSSSASLASRRRQQRDHHMSQDNDADDDNNDERDDSLRDDRLGHARTRRRRHRSRLPRDADARATAHGSSAAHNAVAAAAATATTTPPPPPSRVRTLLARGVDARHCRGALTVVLDLDETLVYARHGGICLRPGVQSLLSTCAALQCEVVVWTAGVAAYVDPLLRAIARVCGRAQWFAHIISRHRCWYGGGSRRSSSSRRGTAAVEARDGVKDMQLLGRPLDRVLVIENNPCAVARQPHHAVLVEDYMRADEADATLYVLCDVVRHVVAHCCHCSSSSSSSSDVVQHEGTSTAVVVEEDVHEDAEVEQQQQPRVAGDSQHDDADDDDDSAQRTRRHGHRHCHCCTSSRRRKRRRSADAAPTNDATRPAMSVPRALACCSSLRPLYFCTTHVQPMRSSSSSTTSSSLRVTRNSTDDGNTVPLLQYYGLVYSPHDGQAVTQRSYSGLHPCANTLT